MEKFSTKIREKVETLEYFGYSSGRNYSFFGEEFNDNKNNVKHIKTSRGHHNPNHGGVEMQEDVRDLKLLAVLNLLNQLSSKHTLNEYLKGTIDFLAGWTGCSHIGIRVLEDTGIAPYVVHQGYDRDFMEFESCLSIHDEDCICVRVLKQEFKEEDKFFTGDSGTYYSQDHTQYMSNLSLEERKIYRGVCAIREYKSLVVMPLLHQDKVVGVIHMADYREGIFSNEDIKFLESIRPLVAEAIYRHNLEKALEKTVRRYEAEEMLIRKLKFEERLASISARFNQQEDFRMAARESLEDILKLFKADHVCLHLGKNLKGYVKATKYGLEDQACPLEGTQVELLREYWKNGEIMCKRGQSPDFKPVEHYAYDVFDQDSILTLPLSFKGNLLGVLSFKNISSGGLSLKEILNPLKLVTETLANAVEQGRIHQKLTRSENRYRTIFHHTGCAFLIIDETFKILLSNQKAQKLLGLPQEQIDHVRNLLDFVPEKEAQRLWEYGQKRLRKEEGIPSQYELTIIDSKGNRRTVINTPVVIPQTTQIVLSLIDVTEWKETEAELYYLSYHDKLTGLYNRVYFEQEMRKYEEKADREIALIMCDVNGLKLINTTFGSEAGDKVLVNVAKLIGNCFEDNLVARIGGDEFVVVLEVGEGGHHQVEQACRLLRSNIRKFNRDQDKLPLDISIGYAISGKGGFTTQELLKKADDAMNREKLHSNNSTRNSQVQILTKALEFRDFITEGHAERVQELILATGRLAGLSEQKLSDLKLFAQFHDIGKVGIPDHILFKKGRLTEEEWKIMRAHSEIGYRIAQAAPDIFPIADWILKHHENWDGSGYPLGLKGEEIPLECRLLAVADTFDAMTNDRPYRKARTVEEAIQEIIRCSGTQFDPEVVELFLKTIRSLPA